MSKAKMKKTFMGLLLLVVLDMPPAKSQVVFKSPEKGPKDLRGGYTNRADDGADHYRMEEAQRFREILALLQDSPTALHLIETVRANHYSLRFPKYVLYNGSELLGQLEREEHSVVTSTNAPLHIQAMTFIHEVTHAWQETMLLLSDEEWNADAILSNIFITEAMAMSMEIQIPAEIAHFAGNNDMLNAALDDMLYGDLAEVYIDKLKQKPNAVLTGEAQQVAFESAFTLSPDYYENYGHNAFQRRVMYEEVFADEI